MEKIVQKTAEKYIKERGRKKRWQKVVTAMAAVVVFCTTYALIMPAVTQQGQAFCGVEEHKEHTADCYETKQVLTCTLSEEGHEHSSECFTVQPVLSCDILETDGHLHDESCYAEDGSLICEEIECEPHHHSDSCYTTEEICVCDLEEQPPHQHSEACYTTEETLVCELPIHEHSLQCFSDPEADIETESVWKRDFQDIKLSKTWADDVIAIATTQIGYAESSKNYQVQTDGVTMNGYSRYGDWYGIPYGDWCAMFCSFCMHYAGVDPDLMPMEAGCEPWIEKLSKPELNLYRPAHNEKLPSETENEPEVEVDEEADATQAQEEEKYIPTPGDLIFFDWDSFDPERYEQRSADHVGLVAELIYDETTGELLKVKTIEGNSHDCVCYNSYDWDDCRILGYGIMPDNPDSGDMFELSAYSEDGVGVMLTGLSDALPFSAEEITLTVTKVYGINAVEQLSQAAEADGLATGNLYLLDVTLWHDGEAVEPTGNVTVTFLDVCSDGESASVYHVDPGTGVTTNMDAVNEDGNAVIDTDHFSIYGVVVNPASGKNVSGNGSIAWDSTNGTITAFTVTASSSEVDKAYFYVQYRDDDGTNWTTSDVVSSGKVGRNNSVTLDASSLIGTAVSASRQYRAYVYKDANNSGYSTAFTLTDLFEAGKPGFTAWLANDYIQNFGGTQPQNQGDLITAFALYESLPTAKIESGLQDDNGIHKLFVDVTLDKNLTGLTYAWEYLDKQDNTWKSLTAETGSSVDVTDLTVLNGGTDVRCKVNNGSTLLAVSNILTVNNSIDALKTSVTVTKKWAGYLVEKPDSVTVRLYQNGTEIDHAELDADSDWTHVFAALPYHENGTVDTYTISEDALEGFSTAISDRVTVNDPGSGIHYLAAGAPENGASYALVGGGYLISGSGSISVSSASVSDSAVTYDGISYTSELIDAPAQGGIWTVTANTDGTYTFKCGDNYLAMASDGKMSLSSSAGTAFSLDDSGHITAVVGGKTRYLKVSNQGLQSSDKSNAASTFTFYKSVDVLGAYDRYEYEITNTGELPNETSVTVTKKWAGSKIGRPDSVTVRLYQDGTALQDAVAVLSADNGWKYVFDALPYQDEDGVPYEYTVSEDAVDGFNTTISDLIVASDTSSGTHYLTNGDLLDGASYALVGGGYVIGANGSSLMGTSANISADVTYDGVAYASEVTNVPAEGSTWTVTANSDGTYTFLCGDYYLAMNKAGNPYLSTETVSGQATTSFCVDENGRISGIVGDKGSTKYIKVTTKGGSFEKLSGADNSNDAAVFTFYEASGVLGAHDRYEYKITNKSTAVPEAPTVQYGKYIDDLGDGVTNPDTALTGDFYRQYLDVEVSCDIAYDFLFVVDNTGSMREKDLDPKKKMQRDQIVCEVLNGTYNGTSTEDGLLTQILRANPDNKIAVATFCGMGSEGYSYNRMLHEVPEVHTVLDWVGIESTTDNIAPYANVLYQEGGGTCYEAGLLKAEEMMQDPVLDDGNAKIVVFLGDGEPNGVLRNASGEIAAKEELSDKDSIYFNWDQPEADCEEGTRNAMDYFIEAVDGMQGPGQEQVELYTISVGYNTDNDILAYMAEKGQGAKYYAYSDEDINAAFTEIISRYLYTNFVITDNLSRYAEVYQDHLDLKVTRVDGSQETVIWQGAWDDSGNIGSAENGGDSYIESVTFTDPTSSDSTGTLTVTFQPNYIMEPGVKYVVSYNLKATDEASEEYEANGYGSTVGDSKTDYPGNTTSSGKSGFHSNESATVTYRDGEELKTGEYPHPVIQVETNENRSIFLAKSSSTDRTLVLGGAGFDLYFDCDEDNPNATAIPGLSGKYGVKVNAETLVTKSIAEGGKLEIPGLITGHYYLVETVTPNGFNTLEAPVEFDLTSGNISTSSDYAFVTDDDPLLITVLNDNWYELPKTGGAGITLYTLGGLILMASTLMYGFMTRRKRERRAN